MPESSLYATPTPPASARLAAIILCGGQSSRMGRPKAWLDFRGQPLLSRVAAILAPVVAPMVVVAADGQEVPPLPEGTEIVRDREPDLGPMAGFAAGLAALEGRADAVFLSACDVPFLRPVFVEYLADCLGDADAAVPSDEGRTYPLSAVYAVGVLPLVVAMLKDRRLRMRSVAESCRAAFVDVERLRSVDPELESLWNVNTPEDYAAALRK